MHHLLKTGFVMAMILMLSAPVTAQPGRGRGFGGRGGGPGRGGHGQGHDERHQQDHQDFKFLLSNHQKIRRTVTELPNGVETLTESDDAAIAAKIQEHVHWMQYRIEETNPIRMRDPLFAELFKHTDNIVMDVSKTDKGVRVREISADPYVTKLIKAHAKVVSGFVERGFKEAMKNHTVPGQDAAVNADFINPAIREYGGVIKLSQAAHQPRADSRICVDVTSGGSPEKLFPSIEKVARFVNIYHGAGESSASAQIAIVLHGDATLSVLNADAYADEFDTKGNPNLDCLHELHEAGVEIYVCGQSLIRKGADPKDVVVFADVAVSGLTSLVNLQADGYAYMPLLK
jgi:intracellular sulfur oxidation DsrE/DsrF family protein